MSLKGHAASYRGVGQPMELCEYEVPAPEPGGAILRTTLANICGSDLHQWRGEFDLVAFGRPMPQILGHEMTGRIHELGVGLTHDRRGLPLKAGDRVVFSYMNPCGVCPACRKGVTRACPTLRGYLMQSSDTPPHFCGAFAEFFYLRPHMAVFKVPDELTDDMVAGINCALSQVVAGLHIAGLRPGETVALQGAGGLGVYATAVAKEMGAGKVIAIDERKERLKLARAFGADEVVDIRELRDPAARAARVRELSDGWGADVVMELAGHPRVVDEGLRMLGRTGRYVEIGNINPGLRCEIDPSQLIFTNLTLYGISYYEPEHLSWALDLLARTRTKYPWDRVISHKFPLAAINEAFAAADRGEVTRAAIAFEGRG
ncbi:MAG: zinc-binding dehydrogenase [Chloroflexota bacterium]|nr:zinc-binding dehydrogenase [Chloroflexota bacterium]